MPGWPTLRHTLLLVAAAGTLLLLPGWIARFAVDAGSYDWVGRLGESRVPVTLPGAAAGSENDDLERPRVTTEPVARAVSSLVAPASPVAILTLLLLLAAWPAGSRVGILWALAYAPVALARLVLLSFPGHPDVPVWTWFVAHGAFLAASLVTTRSPAYLAIGWVCALWTLVASYWLGPLALVLPAGLLAARYRAATANRLTTATVIQVTGAEAESLKFGESLAALTNRIQGKKR